MTFTLVAYHKAAISATLLALQPIADPHVTVAGDDITVPELDQIVASLGFGGAPTQMQIQSPSMREIFLEDLPSMILTEVTTPSLGHLLDRRDSPIPLVRSEKLNVFSIHTTDGWCLIWLADGPITPVTGEIRTIRATTGHTANADVWENVALALTQTLPAGRYEIVGMHAFGTNLLAARLLFVGGGWRPGVPAGADINSKSDDRFRSGMFGSFGEFEFDQPPTIDLLGTGVTAAEEIFLDLIQVRKGR